MTHDGRRHPSWRRPSCAAFTSRWCSSASSRPRPSASTRPPRSAATATSPPARRRPPSASSTRCRPTTCWSPATAATASRSPAGTSPEAVMAELFGRARRLRPRPRRLDAPARRRPRLLRRLGHRRRPAPGRDRPGARARPPRQGAGGRLRARRRRREHGRLARVAEPRRAVEPAGRLPRRQQRATGWARASSAPRPSPTSTSAPRAYRMHGERVDGDDLEAVIEASDRLLRARPRGARAGRARGRHLPLPRPLGRRRRARLPHEGGDRRAPGARPDRAACARRCASAASATTSSTRSTARPTSASPPRSRSPTRAPSPSVAELAAGVYAPGSGEQFARMRPGSPFGEEELVFDAGLGA